MTRYRFQVVVPACNEEALLPETLRSVRAAINFADRMLHRKGDSLPTSVASCLPPRSFASNGLDAMLTVVAHRCTDRTAEVAAPWADRVLELSEGTLGDARNLGRLGTEDRLTLMTDADSTVPEHWVLEHLRHMGDGAGVVAGTVVVADWSEREPGLRTRYETEYSLANEHVHGANLAGSAEAFESLGGFQMLDSSEDQDFVDRALASGLRVDWCSAVAVTTSARRVTRARRGFGAYLDKLQAAGAER